jgi:molecular chaperone GrpE (heat shock protein)
MQYFKIGKEGNSFFDPSTKLDVFGTKVGFIKGAPSKLVVDALSNGHIVEITEKEFTTLGGKLPSKEKGEASATTEEKTEETKAEEPKNQSQELQEKIAELSPLSNDDLIESAEGTDWGAQELKDFEKALKSKAKGEKEAAIKKLAEKLLEVE